MKVFIWSEKLRNVLADLRSNESGAFLLLSLIAILIVIMAALSMYDTGQATRTKLRTQMATDTSAYSASVVRARAMNMIAYGNVAKRSIVGVVVGYENAWQLLDTVHNGAKIAANLPKTKETIPIIERGKRVLKKIDKVWKGEKKDYKNFKGNIKSGYMPDLVAIENVQKYFDSLIAWWMFSEVSDRAIRNGMTAGAMYPVPVVDVGTDYGPIGQTMDDRAKKMGMLGGRAESKLPIVKMTPKDLLSNMNGSDYAQESLLMVKAHSDRNENKDFDQFTQASSPKGGVVGLKADELFVFGMALGGGYTSYDGSFTKIMKSLGVVALPYVLRRYDESSKWTFDSLTLVMTYLEAKGLSGKGRERFNILPRGYDTGDVNYKVEGHWNMAMSEIFFKDGGANVPPDMWHTQWSARMRPMSFQNEWDRNGLTFGSAATEMIAYLVVSAALGGSSNVTDSFSENDIEILSNMARGLDAKGISGIGK